MFTIHAPEKPYAILKRVSTTVSVLSGVPLCVVCEMNDAFFNFGVDNAPMVPANVTNGSFKSGS